MFQIFMFQIFTLLDFGVLLFHSPLFHGPMFGVPGFIAFHTTKQRLLRLTKLRAEIEKPYFRSFFHIFFIRIESNIDAENQSHK